VDGVAPTTAEVRRAAEMSTTMAPTVMAPAVMATAMMATAMMATAMMATAMMTTAVATTAMTATFRGGIPGGRQHGRENNQGNLDIEF
jgi:hypothetical protein